MALTAFGRTSPATSQQPGPTPTEKKQRYAARAATATQGSAAAT